MMKLYSYLKKIYSSLVWGCITVIPACGRQEDCCEFVASLDYVSVHYLETQDNRTKIVFKVNADNNK